MNNQSNKYQVEIASNNNFLLGSPKKNRNNKTKKPLIIKLYWYLLIKLFSLISVITITSITILSSIILPIVFLTISSNPYEQIKSLQYFILIFYNIFLFIFILFISVRIFLNQIEDNSFLLLITKPYSRIKIVLIQYLVVFSASIFLILCSTLFFFLMGYIVLSKNNLDFINFFKHVTVYFLLFSLFFSCMLITSIVIFSSLFSSKTVFLFFSVICSLFILGSLPYSLFTAKINQTAIKINDNSTNSPEIPYALLDESIKFNDYLSKNLIKYPVVTKKIYDFIMNFSYDDVNASYYITNWNQRLKFFKDYDVNMISNKVVPKEKNFSVKRWDLFQISSNTNVDLSLTLSDSIKTVDQIKDDISNNLASDFEKEILEIYQDSIKKDPNFLSSLFSNKQTLINKKDRALLNISSVRLNSSEPPPSFNVENFISDYLNDGEGNKTFIFDSTEDQKNFDEIFQNPILFILSAVEHSIFSEAIVYMQCRDNSLDYSDSNIYSYSNYKKLISQYSLLNKINLFEHWNQLWTSWMGIYGNFDFDLTKLELRNKLDIEQNSFFSYPLSYWDSNNSDKKLILSNNNTIQNSNAVIISYLILSVVFFSVSLVIWRYKNII